MLGILHEGLISYYPTKSNMLVDWKSMLIQANDILPRWWLWMLRFWLLLRLLLLLLRLLLLSLLRSRTMPIRIISQGAKCLISCPENWFFILIVSRCIHNSMKAPCIRNIQMIFWRRCQIGQGRASALLNSDNIPMIGHGIDNNPNSSVLHNGISVEVVQCQVL